MSDTHSMQADLSIVLGSTLQVLFCSTLLVQLSQRNEEERLFKSLPPDHSSGKHADVREEIPEERPPCHMQPPAHKAGEISV